MEKRFNWENATLAHPGKRYQAQFIDGLIAISLFALCVYLFKLLALEGSLTDAITVLVPFSYFVFSDSLPKGQSLGKKPFGIYVISKSTGKPCTILQSFARNAFTPILGFLDAILIFGKKHQRLGDKFANTIVVKNG